MSSEQSNAKRPYIGGQAVIEGVMMRAPGCMSIAVRRPNGSIAVKEGPLSSRFDKKMWKMPGFRGVAALVDSMKIGFGALQFSADQQMTVEEREQAGAEGKLAIAFSVIFALGLFVALPQALAAGSGKLFGIDFGLSDANYQIAIGAFKLLIFLCYLLLISRLKDVRRVFQYHGAEHKTINAYEADLDLTVENVRNQTTMHPRCGTTFLVVVVVVSIIAGAITAPILMPNAEGIIGQVALLVLRIALLPFIAAVSFELQRLSARFCTTGPLRLFLLPGFFFQKISTREPEDDQIEIAIAAFEAAAWREKDGKEQPVSDDPMVFPSFDTFVSELPKLVPAQWTEEQLAAE